MKIYRLHVWITSFNHRKRRGQYSTEELRDAYFVGRKGLKTAKEEFGRWLREMRVCHFSYTVTGTSRTGRVTLEEHFPDPDTGSLRHRWDGLDLQETFTN